MEILRKFTSRQEGATLIEYAAIAPVLILLTMAIIEFGLMLFTELALESAVTRVSRTVTIGDTGGAPDRVTYIKGQLLEETEALMYADRIIISTEVVNSGQRSYIEPETCLTNPPRLGPSCPPGIPFVDRNNNGLYDAGNLGSNVGQASDLVEVKVALPWAFFTPLISEFFESGVYVIRASAIVKNEPF
jgi:Flp pilus assembly pilin Flp